MRARRVVTGINAEGKSFFVHDGPTPGYLDADYFQTSEIWADDPNHPDPEAKVDPVDVDVFKQEPPDNGGSRIRIFTFAPAGFTPTKSREELIQAFSRYDTQGAMEKEDPAWHTTKSIDYGIVLNGEIYLELDEGEVLLKQGDVVVQRATRHAWRNRSSEPCTMAFILIKSPNYS